MRLRLPFVHNRHPVILAKERVILSSSRTRGSRLFSWIPFFKGMTPSRIVIIFSALFIALLAGIMFRNQISTFFSADPGSDPVAYWKFDEGQGSTTQDWSTSNNDGTLGTGSSAPTWVSEDSCVSRKCLRFDGSDDYAQTADATVLDISGTSPITQSLWVKLNVYPTTFRAHAIMTTETGHGSTTYDKGIRISTSGKAGFYLWDGAEKEAVSNTTLSLGQWYFIAGVYDGANVYIYVNGKPDNTSAVTASSTYNFTTPQLVMSYFRDVSSSEYFRGFIDEVKIYDYARSADQIKAEYAARGTTKGVAARFGDDDLGRKLSSGLVGYWKMDEVGVSGSAWTAIDSSGNGNNGTGNDNASVGTTAPGKFGNAGFFDGSGDYVTTADVDLTGSYSWGAWVNIPSMPSIANIIVKRSSGDNNTLNYFLYTGSSLSNKARCLTRQATDFADSTTAISTSTWTHIMCVQDSSSIKVYMNGILDGIDSSLTGTESTNNTSTTIGSSSHGDQYFVGSIDEVRIYNRSLAPDEVKDLYEFAPGPVVYLDLNENTGASTVYDKSSNGNNGTMNGSMTESDWVAGKYGSALDLDGVNDNIRVADADSLDFGTSTDFTFETWIKMTGNSKADQDFFDKQLSSIGPKVEYITGGTGWQAYIHGGVGLFCAIRSTTDLEDNTWHHIVAVFKRSSSCTTNDILLYVDGQQESTTVNSSDNNTNVDITNTGVLDISDPSDEVQGLMDDVRVYNYARTQKQIISDMNAGHPAVGTPVGSTVGFWKMNEGYGSTTYDSSPQLSNATLATGSSAPAWTNDGKFGRALDFDGTSDYASIGDVATLRFDDTLADFSAFAWIRRDVAGATHTVLSKEDADNDGWRLQIDSGDTVTCSTGVTDITSAKTITDTNWHHVGCTIDRGGNGQVYVDALASGAAVGVGSTAMATTAALNIGSRSYTRTSFFNGIIDDVRLYPFALTADQVKTVYNQGEQIVLGANSTGVGGTTPSTSAGREYCVPGDSSTCSAPIGEWLFNEGVGTSGFDTSTNAHTGLVKNSPQWVAGKKGNGLSFEGSSSYVALGANTFAGSYSQFTISAWIQNNNDTATQRVAVDLGVDLSNRRISIHNLATVGKIVAGVQGTCATTPEYTSMSVNTWYHVVLTFTQNDSCKLYINGALADSETATNDALALNTGNEGENIGGRITGVDNWKGLIDEVRFYDYARTSAQIAWEYNRGGPVTWYKLDECTGTTANDWGPTGNGGYNGNNGFINIGPGGSNDAAGSCSGDASESWENGETGKYGASLHFDDSDDYVTVADTSLLDFPEGNNFTVTAWVNIPSLANNNTVVAKKISTTAGNAGYMMHVNSSGQVAANIADGVEQATKFTKDTISAATWAHIGMVYVDDTSLTLYINGKNAGGDFTVASDAIGTVDDVSNAAVLAIGGESDLGLPMSGQIDDVRIFNYALTPNQIRDAMNSGAVRFE